MVDIIELVLDGVLAVGVVWLWLRQRHFAPTVRVDDALAKLTSFQTATARLYQRNAEDIQTHIKSRRMHK